ncbi:hypothetical protein L0244_08795 [bacterium]|nr:hypothetical protein [bacterium]
MASVVPKHISSIDDRLELDVSICQTFVSRYQITRWAYEQAELSGASVWSAKDVVHPLTPAWKSIINR